MTFIVAKEQAQRRKAELWITISALALALAVALSITVTIISAPARIARARESIRAEHAKAIRQATEIYTADKGHGPDSLNDLVKSGYLKSIPEDPR
jgi:general secretion pathway protein G